MMIGETVVDNYDIEEKDITVIVMSTTIDSLFCYALYVKYIYILFICGFYSHDRRFPPFTFVTALE